MLKVGNSLKSIESRAVEMLEDLLARIPDVDVRSVELRKGADILVHFSVGDRLRTLACAVKANGQPRHVRAALAQLLRIAPLGETAAIPLLIARYLSPDAQSLCREAGVGFMDLEGNARLIFDGVYLERQVASKPSTERRELKSLFTPKSSRVLRALLREPARRWRVVELAAAAAVSLGHVSNVRAALLDREWADVSADGLRVHRPNALLDAWKRAYAFPVMKRLSFYTTLNGAAFDEATRRVVGTHGIPGQVLLASYSAAQWLAPYARTGTHYFYCDVAGLENLHAAIALSTASKGQNISVALPADEGVFLDAVEPAEGVRCTSAVQTYLDLSVGGERGVEAAEHLRKQLLAW